ncbi:MAG: hypothetical protein ACLQOO_31435 [Terriglobia bacterium]
MRRVTIDDLIQGLLNVSTLRRGPQDRDPVAVREAMLPTVDKDVALGELALLRVCAALCACQAFFRAADQAKVRRTLARLLPPMVMDCGDPRIKGQPEKAMEELNRRYPLYLEALSTPNDLGPSRNAGTVFARLCGHESDKLVAMAGWVEFQGAILGAKGFLSDFRTYDGGEVIDLPQE